MPRPKLDPRYTTVCFEGDARKVASLFDQDTPFGKVITVSVGDVFEERDWLEQELERVAR